METETRNLRARSLARLQQGVFRRYVNFRAVDDDLGHFDFSYSAAAR